MSAVSSAHQQVLDFLSCGDFYSAHQKARTIATRLLAPPRRGAPPAGSVLPYDQKAQEAAEVLWDAARKLLEQGQQGSGVDLGVMLVEDVWKAREIGCGKDERDKIVQLIALTGPSGAWRKTLADAVFSWTAKTGSGPAGDVEIHQYLGETLYKELNYHQATLHLLVCPTQDAARTLANVLFDWSKLDKEGETAVGRYAARGALSYLESTFILAARTFLSHFLSLSLTSYPDLSVVRFPYPPPSSSLAQTTPPPAADELVMTKLASLNFLQLAVRAAQVGVGEAIEKVKNGNEMRIVRGQGTRTWTALVQRYEKQVPWLRQGEIKDSTTALGEIYFGIKPARQSNPLMDMMASMLGGGGGGAPAIGAR
ncbi:hypothetical protein JCM21900_003359 [Sporobolomyces salmonicolor]